MGRFVTVWKLRETEDEVEYAYGPEPGSAGALAVSKFTGEVQNLRGVPGYSPEYNAVLHLQLAAAKAQMLQRSGSFPDEASLAT